MSGFQRLLGLFGVVSSVGLGILLVKVLNIGMAAAWAGDTDTVGGAIIVLMLILLAAALSRAIHGR